MTKHNSPAAASLLMKGRLTETSTGVFNLDDTVSDGIPGLTNGRELDFLKDGKQEMTWGRRIALSLMHYSWYNPKVGLEESRQEKDGNNDANGEDFDDEFDSLVIQSKTSFPNPGEEAEYTSTDVPSLEKAWAYFEHVALDRYIVENEKKVKKKLHIRVIRKFQKGDKKLDKAEPGDNTVKTRLYSPVFTPHGQLGDFGLGVGLYFSTLRAITAITFVLGLISLYNIAYFNSDDYMPGETRNITDFLLMGSAICTNTPWVPCPTCNCSSEDDQQRGLAHEQLYFSRCGTSAEDDSIVFAKKNDCDGTPWQIGAVNYATVLLLFIATAVLGEYLRRQEVAFDEDEQTAQDYSVKVSNPPPDARDPEEWRKFFSENLGAQLTVSMKVKKNGTLMSSRCVLPS